MMTTTILLVALLTLLAFVQTPSVAWAAETSGGIRVFGLVNNPLVLSDAELLSLPMVSEATHLLCVAGLPDGTFNWTGIPIFHILTLAQVKPEAVEVVFRARSPDTFSSSLTITEALKPAVILAFKANGTVLLGVPGIPPGILGGYRLVVPCKYGYKWVGNVGEIEVVDYDYKGTYESVGYSDEADIENCTPSSINPPLQTFNLTLGHRTFQIEAFTNISITAFHFDYLLKEIKLNATVPLGATGFVNINVTQDLLKGPYGAYLDEQTIGVSEANVTGLTFLYVAFQGGLHVVRLVGTEFFGVVPSPEIETINQPVSVGENLVFNATRSADDGEIVSYEWSFGDGASGTGAVVSHSYVQEGTYQVTLNVTDNDGLSNYKTLTVTVKRLIDILTIIKVASIVTIIALALTFLVLLKRRKPRNTQAQNDSS